MNDGLKYYLLGIVTIIIFLGVGAGGYFLGKNTGGISLKATPSPSPHKQEVLSQAATPLAATPAPTIKPLDQHEQIKSAISTKKYELLSAYLADEVEVIKKGTGCCGALDANDTLFELDFLADSQGEWYFDDRSLVISRLIEEVPNNFSSSFLIGVSEDKYGVIIGFDQRGLISKIHMSTNYNLLLE